MPDALAPPPWRTTTVRQCHRALAWTLGLTLVFTAWHAVEKWGFHLDRQARLVRSPALVPMVALGVPHFTIAALFLATSPRRRSAASRATLVALLLAGVALAWAYGAAGAQAPRHKIPVAAVMLLFAVHQLRDESHLFLAYGDGPRGIDPARTRRFTDAWTAALLLALSAAFVAGLEAYNTARGRAAPLGLLAPGVPLGARLAVVLAAGALLAWARLRAWRRRDPDGLAAWLGRVGPLLAVEATFLGVVVAGAAASAVLEALVLWHVMSWLLYSLHRIGAATAAGPAPAPPRSLLDRARRTRRGFLALHLGLAALVFLAMLAWTYGTGKDPASPLRLVADPDVFYYWTILHVVTSFAPR